MTAMRTSPRLMTSAACMALSLLTTQVAFAADVSGGRVLPAGIVHFDLPAQPLARVLQAFGGLTDLVVVVPRPLLDGRTSTPIDGDYLPGDALRHILAGTGLEANFIGVGEAIIAPATATSPAPASANSQLIEANAVDGVLSGGGDYRSYVAMIQTRLTGALCESALTRPGSYRLVAQLRVDDSGRIAASNMIEPTGLPDRDSAIERTLRMLVLDSPPPAGFPEPVTILLRPSGNGVHVRCPMGDGQG